MELNLQLTPRSRVLLGILGVVLLMALAIRVVPALYGLFADQDIKAKQEQLRKTENLVQAAEILKPIESAIYKEIGLATAAQQPIARLKSAPTIFDREHPETVIRAQIDALVKRAGIQQNYQLLTKSAPGKRTEKFTAQTQQNLVLYLYLKHLETEQKELEALDAQEEEDETFANLMDAWLSGDEPAENEKADSGESYQQGRTSETVDGVRYAPTINADENWEFASLPEAIPVTVRVELAAFIKSMISQQLLGATDFRQGFFEAQVRRVTKAAKPGFFGIGAKPATVEILFRQNSVLLDSFTQAMRAYEGTLQQEEYLHQQDDELVLVLVEYVEKILQQRTELFERLALAPPTYQPNVYIVEMKFKTDMEKLVNLNHLIEMSAKWLRVRDLRISADTQANARSGEAEGRGRNASARTTSLSIDVLMIAQIFK